MTENREHRLLPWAAPAEEAARRYEVDPARGLSADEARRRLASHGPNRLREARRRGPLLIFLRQFADLMIVLLAVAAVISASIQEWTDAGLIAVIVVANAVIGAFQEWRAEQAVAALKKLSQPSARVWRDGRLAERPAEELVPGDVVEVRGGDFVPADARLLEASDLQVDEAALTGESLPVEKSSEPVAPDTPLPDRRSMIFAGTAAGAGHARAVVTATGMSTELGNIATLLGETERVQTPLQRRLAALSKRLAVLVIVICLIIFVAGLLREEPGPLDAEFFARNQELLGRMLLVAVSLAVAAIPEGLPAVITVALALGSRKAAERKAIMRRLAAVETLGSVDVICSDKTGTLTQNRMALADAVAAAESDEIEQELIRGAALCNDADLAEDGKAVGTATEAALLRGAADRGLDIQQLRSEWPRLDEIPFSSSRKRMSTLHQASDGRRQVFVKGAAEAILSRCDSVAANGPETAALSDEKRAEWQHRAEDLAGRGRRVLAVARRDWDGNELPDDGQAESSLTLLGLVALIDPVRPEVGEAISKCHSAGIRTVMITGDHRGTARAIAEELGMWREGDKAVDGVEFEQYSDEQLERDAPKLSVYARVSPEHKLRIVKAHQARGSVVGMTGDGVNDAPALKQADIGIAMGQTGTDVSKEAADMILADDNFATIVAAVEEGRVVYDNIRKFVRYLLTANAAEILVLFLGIISGMPLPLLPVHILWINLVTDGLPALALGFQPAEEDIMERPPRPREESVFAGGVARDIVLLGSLMGVVCIALYYVLLNQWLALPVPAGTAPGTQPHAEFVEGYARTMVFVTLSLSQLAFVMAIRSLTRMFHEESLLLNYRLTAAVIIGVLLQLSVVYLPGLRDFFHAIPPSLPHLGLALLLATPAFWVVEARKAISRATSG